MAGARPRAGALISLVLWAMLAVGCGWPTAELQPVPTEVGIASPHSTPTPTPTVHPRSTLVASDKDVPMMDWEAETMKLVVVFDNQPFDPRLRTGWGFSAWLEYGPVTVLFDTGADGKTLLANLSALGLDPQAIDIVVLSHSHGDHTGGLASLLAVNPNVTAVLLQSFPARIKQQVRAAGAVLVEVEATLEILPGLWSTGPLGTGLAEQALVARTGNGLVVVTGCAHPGVDEAVGPMVARSKQIGGEEIALVLGGFHMAGASRARVQEIVGELRQLGVQQVAPCHCTGNLARELFREAYGDDYLGCGVGWQWQDRALLWQPSGQGIPAQIGVAALAIAPADPRVAYLAAFEPGGLYRSDDGGDSWRVVSQGVEAVAPLTVAVHPRDSDLAWVGTMVGGYRTVDGGQVWQPMADLPPVPIYALAVSHQGDTLYAAGETPGVWRSEDGGRTWRANQTVDVPDAILSLAITADGRILAGTAGQGVWYGSDGGQLWQAQGRELTQAYVPRLAVLDGRWVAMADGCLTISSDGGQSWQTLSPPGSEVLSFGADPSPAGWLYLGSKGAGIVVSQDGGLSWDQRGDELRHADITALAVDVEAPGHIYVGTRYHGLHRSDDGGKSWRLISAGLGRAAIAALAQDPANPQIYYAGALDGVYRSDDGGEHWHLMSGSTGKLLIQSLAVAPTGERIYAGTQTGLYVSQDDGATWRWAEDTAGIAVFDIAFDPQDADRVYAGSWGHNILLSINSGQTWAPIHHGLETLSVHAIAVDPVDPQRLYAGTVEEVYCSTDGGKTWLVSRLADRPLTVFDLVIDSDDPARVYAGTTEGVFLSADGGQSWQPVSHESMGATVTALAWQRTGTILAGTEHHGLFGSTDSGRRWLSWGLEATSVYAILVDRAGTVWLGTDRGVFRNR